MKLNLEQLQLICPENIWIDFSSIDLENNTLAAMNFTNATAYNNAKINHLCLTVFVKWLEDNLGIEENQLNVSQTTELASIWEAINGTTITLDETKIILIPSEAIDIEEFVVTQEWVDIADLAGNYYLPIQVDWDSNIIRVWGYTSHEILKNKGEYDPIYRTYSLAKDNIIEDLETLWLAIDYGLKETEDIPAIANLPTNTAEQLIDKLSKPSPYSPRLELGFEKWAALFGDRNLRQQLYQTRLVNSTKTPAEKHNLKTKLINLTNWLNEQFTESIASGWHSVDELLINPQRQLAYRSNSSLRKKSSDTVERGKLIRLQMQVDSVEVVLLVGVTSEAEDKVKVLIQLHPNSDNNYLPSNLTFSIFSEGQAIGKPVVSQESDLYIQSLPLRCSRDTDFTVKICLGEALVTEEFTIT